MKGVMETDVAVIGAGASGIPAAVAAARGGARVLLLEEDAVIGGAAMDCYVNMLCGGPRTGIVRELELLLQRSYTFADDQRFYFPESFHRAYYALIKREKGIQVLTGARATGASLAEGKIKPRLDEVHFTLKKVNDLRVKAKVFIDATGTGGVAELAGCRIMYGRESSGDFGEKHAPPERDKRVQTCTWLYYSQDLGNAVPVDMRTLDATLVLVNGIGMFKRNPEEAMKVRPRVYLHWGCSVRCEDTRDPAAISEVQFEALNAMERDHAVLREKGYSIHLAPKIGIREQGRVLGEHVLSENDLVSGRLPEDTVSVTNRRLDLWGGDFSKEESMVPWYGIPYRSLVAKDADGLLLCGKAISGTHLAMSSYRVMPVAGSIGQAAGAAAAMCAEYGLQPNEIDSRELIKKLKGPGHNLKVEV